MQFGELQHKARRPSSFKNGAALKFCKRKKWTPPTGTKLRFNATLRFTKTRARRAPCRALPPHLSRQARPRCAAAEPRASYRWNADRNALLTVKSHRVFPQGFKGGAAPLRGCSKEQRSFESPPYVIVKKTFFMYFSRYVRLLHVKHSKIIPDYST